MALESCLHYTFPRTNEILIPTKLWRQQSCSRCSTNTIPYIKIKNCRVIQAKLSKIQPQKSLLWSRYPCFRFFCQKKCWLRWSTLTTALFIYQDTHLVLMFNKETVRGGAQPVIDERPKCQIEKRNLKVFPPVLRGERET